jgi:hypothetical protein
VPVRLYLFKYLVDLAFEDVATGEQGEPDQHLGALQQWKEVPDPRQAAQEGRRFGRWRWLRQKTEEAVQSEHEENGTQYDARDRGQRGDETSHFHSSLRDPSRTLGCCTGSSSQSKWESLLPVEQQSI